MQRVQLPSAPQLPAPPYSAASQDSWTGARSQCHRAWLITHGVIYLKTPDAIALLSLLATCNWRGGVFSPPRVFPKIPTVHQGLSHCGMQICVNILSEDEKKRKRGEGKWETASPDASQLHLANEHKCHCQAENEEKMCHGGKLCWSREDSRTCFAYEEVNAQGEGEGLHL